MKKEIIITLLSIALAIHVSMPAVVHAQLPITMPIKETGKPKLPDYELVTKLIPGENYIYKGKYGCNHLAVVGVERSYGRKYGFVDRNGKEMVPLMYDSLFCGNEFNFLLSECPWVGSMRLLSVCQKGNWGYINKNGELVIPMIYDEVKGFIEIGENTILVKKNGRWGFINDQNHIMVPLKYSTANLFDETGLACVSINGHYGFVNQNGQEVIPLQYEKYTSHFFNNRAAAVKNGKLGFLNPKGEVVIPFQYELKDKAVLHFRGSVIPVKKDGKYGVIDTLGKVVLPFIYSDYRYYTRGQLDMIKDDDHTVYLDKAGNIYQTFEGRIDSSTVMLANKGFAEEQYRMGEDCYFVKEDYETAKFWFQKAANQNHDGGCYMLAEMYEQGRGGLPRDCNAALIYYQKIKSGEFLGSALCHIGKIYYHNKKYKWNLIE